MWNNCPVNWYVNYIPHDSVHVWCIKCWTKVQNGIRFFVKRFWGEMPKRARDVVWMKKLLFTKLCGEIWLPLVHEYGGPLKETHTFSETWCMSRIFGIRIERASQFITNRWKRRLLKRSCGLFANSYKRGWRPIVVKLRKIKNEKSSWRSTI